MYGLSVIASVPPFTTSKSINKITVNFFLSSPFEIIGFRLLKKLTVPEFSHHVFKDFYAILSGILRIS